MLPRLEKDICVSEVKSSKLPVGIKVSMAAKLWPSTSAERRDATLLEPGDCASWTTMEGRLGVLRRLVGDEGPLLAGHCDDARAESLRSMSPARCVWVKAEARGPGEVRGRRTLLSHERDAGLVADALASSEDVGERSGGESSTTGEAVSAPGERTGSSIMAASGAGVCHEIGPQTE